MSSSTADDYYSILGVPRDADAEQIKRRFRKLARECHPDIVGDDPVAVERFTRIREAYETLIDPERRQRYDNPPRAHAGGTFYRSRWRPPGGFHFDGLHNGSTASSPPPRTSTRQRWRDPANNLDLDDLFGDFAGAGGSASSRPPPSSAAPPDEDAPGPGSGAPAEAGEDIHLSVEVPSHIARAGGTVTVSYSRLRRSERGDTLFRYSEICDLRVPPNTRHGATLRVPRMGNAGAGGGPYGDLIADVRLATGAAPPPAEDAASSAAGVAGGDALDVPISVTEALLGGRIEVSTPGGRVRITVPPCTSSGTRLRLRGRGPDGSDLFIALRIVVPQQLDDESRRLIEQFAALNPDVPRD